MRYNRKTVQVITAPADLPVSVADMKAYLRIDGDDDDSMLEAFIKASADFVKQYLRRSLMTETLELTMDGFSAEGDSKLLALGPGVHTGSREYYTDSGASVELPFAPIQSITSVTTYNRSNTSAVYSSSNYELDETGGRIYLNEGSIWPNNLRDREAVKIRYVAGYASAAAIPASITQAIKMHVAQMYECREACDMGMACKALLDGYKRYDDLGYC